MDTVEDLDQGREVSVDSSAISLITRGEIDMQIATAHKYPRSLKKFRDETLQMVTLDETIARECYYVLLRKQWDPDKRKSVDVVIQGPSARFAEVVVSAWGNCRAGARIVSDQGGFITAQGLFHDLERNVAIAYEVQRNILTRNGDRFKQDMVATTGNAASSIALRNAILKGVPKAFWASMYAAACRCALGDFKTLNNRRKDALQQFTAYGVRPEAIFAKLGVQGVEDISLNHLAILHGILTAIQDGDTTPELAFAPDPEEAAAPAGPPPTVPRKPKTAAPPPSTGAEVQARMDVAKQGEATGEAPSSEPPPWTEDIPPPEGVLQGDLPMPKAVDWVESTPRLGMRMATVGERRMLLKKITNHGSSVDEALSLLDTPPSDVDGETLLNLTYEDFKALKEML